MAEIKIVPDSSALYRAATEEFVRQANDAVHARGVFQVALSGGSTPKGMFGLLANDESLRQQTPWDKIQFWWSDERHVPPENSESNFKTAQDNLLSRIPVPLEHIHRVRAEKPDAAQAAEEYEQELRDVFQVAAPTLPRFDLIVLGMGNEGHTASLFPGTKALNETTRLVVSNWVGKLYTWRITFTAPLINNARCVMELIGGDDKALALKGVLEGPYEPDQLPVQLVHPRDGRMLWLLDEKSASQLSKK
jgi:6-phosphogluconolactonase